MSNARFFALLGAPLGLLGAFCAGAILSPFSTPPASSSAPATLAHSEESPRASEGELSPSGDRWTRRDEPAPVLSMGELGEERVRALAANFREEESRGAAHPASPDAGETFAIEGKIATPDGEPVSGALVRTIRADMRFASWEAEFLERPTDGRPGERTLENALRAAAKRHAEISRDLRSAQTDAQGLFRISGLRAGLGHSLEAFCAGYEIVDMNGNPFHDVVPGAPVPLLAKPLVKIPLRIEESDGQLLDAALVQIEATSHGWSMPRAWRREDAAIYLSAGTYRLHASHMPSRGLSTEPLQVEVVPAAEPRELVLRFKNSARLEIRVTGRELAGPERRSLQVRVAEHEGGRAPTRDELRWSGRPAEPSGSGSPALYIARDLSAGPHTIAVLLGEQRVLAQQVLEIAAGTNTLELSLPERSDDRIVAVHAADPQGRGIPDLQLWIQREAEDGADDHGVLVLPMDEVGALWHLVHEFERLGPAVKWRLHATSPRHGQIVREYDPGTTEKLELRFVDGARLEVLVPNARGATLVLERPPRPEAPKEREELTQSEFDESGRALLGPIAPGRYVARIDLRFHNWNSIPALEREVDLVPGANRLELVLPALYSVQLAVPGEPKPAGHLRLQYRNTDERELSFGIELEDGLARLENLPAGRYEAHMHVGKEPERRRVEFSLPGPAEVVLQEPQRATRVPGIALPELDPGTRAAQLGFQKGDVLLGIAGRSLEDPQTAWALLLAAPHFLEGESFAIEVQRGGQRVELNVPRELLLDPAGNGFGKPNRKR
ncbi:MAG: hypothetical protein JNM84_23205 [Planctomycetes bacterium]|nr:hypothetical protein [Planctomycetota bacterium]